MSFNLKQSTQFTVNKIAINSKFGTFDVSAVFEELNIFDSVLMPCISGNILIKDSIGLSKKLLFDGSEFIDIDIEVQCSSGTYIRSIARDLGDNLKVGGHLIKLNRSEVAPFFLNEAKKLENSEIIPIKSGIERVLPIRVLTPEEEREIFFGRPISKSIAEIVVGIMPDGEYAAVLTNKDQGGITLSFPSLVNVKE